MSSKLSSPVRSDIEIVEQRPPHRLLRHWPLRSHGGKIRLGLASRSSLLFVLQVMRPKSLCNLHKKQMKFLPTRSHCWNQCPWRSRKLERCCPISSVISYQVKRTRIILFKEARLHFLGKNLPVQSVRDLWVGISNVDHNVTNSVHLWPIYQFEIKGKVYWDWDWNWGVRTFKLNAWGSEADVVTANCKKCKNWK